MAIVMLLEGGYMSRIEVICDTCRRPIRRPGCGLYAVPCPASGNGRVEVAHYHRAGGCLPPRLEDDANMETATVGELETLLADLMPVGDAAAAYDVAEQARMEAEFRKRFEEGLRRPPAPRSERCEPGGSDLTDYDVAEQARVEEAFRKRFQNGMRRPPEE